MDKNRKIRLGLVLVAGLMWSPPSAGLQGHCGMAVLGTHGLFHCISGSGTPTIVLNAGARLSSRTWDILLPYLASTGSVLTFDRAGLGRSEAGPEPRSPTRIARELAELLRVTALPGPYLLVGHSAGGTHMVRFAELYPEDVMAVVLIDTPAPSFEIRRMGLLTESERAERRRLLEEGRAAALPAVRSEYEGGQLEGELEFDSYPRHVPLLAIAANGQDFGSLGSQEAHAWMWVELQAEWLRLSEASKLVMAEGSGHMVHRERAELVAEVIGAVVEEWRRNSGR